MVMFSRLFWIFEKSKAHKDLEDAYYQLNELAELLNKNIAILQEIQKVLVSRNIKQSKYKETPTGALGLEKTLFIEDGLLKDLMKLANITETKFNESFKESSKVRPVSKIEKEEMLKITGFLEMIKKNIPSLDQIQKLSDRDKLWEIERVLREIVILSKKYYEEENKIAAVKKLGEEEISELLRAIYLSPEQHPHQPSLLLYKITNSELRELENESRKINDCNDPNYKIEWRRWWRDVQVPEKDKKTPLKDAHINVTIKLFGGQKRDIHLLLKAA